MKKIILLLTLAANLPSLGMEQTTRQSSLQPFLQSMEIEAPLIEQQESHRGEKACISVCSFLCMWATCVVCKIFVCDKCCSGSICG